MNRLVQPSPTEDEDGDGSCPGLLGAGVPADAPPGTPSACELAAVFRVTSETATPDEPGSSPLEYMFRFPPCTRSEIEANCPPAPASCPAALDAQTSVMMLAAGSPEA